MECRSDRPRQARSGGVTVAAVIGAAGVALAGSALLYAVVVAGHAARAARRWGAG